MNPEIARDDLEAFSAPPPEERIAAEKEAARRAKDDARQAKALRPEQIKMAAKLNEEMKADAEAAEKARLIQQLADYLKLLAEYYPERREYVRAPKNFGPKNSCEELRVWIKEVENELGKQGGLQTLKMAWVEGFKFFEQVNATHRFGLHVEGIGAVAQRQVSNVQLPDGTVVPGEMTPTLAEFAVKYNSWFSSSVEWRLAMAVMNMVAGVHRINMMQGNVQKAAETPVAKETANKIKKL